MSRAAQSTTRNLTDQQLAQQNQLISQSNQQDQQDRSLMMPTITSLLNSQGYTPQQQSDITQQSLGASNTAFNALNQRAANRAAATTRPRAGADRREPGAAESNRLRQPATQGTARRTECPRANLRRRYQSAWQGDGCSLRTPQRAPARFHRLFNQRTRKPLRRRLWYRLALRISGTGTPAGARICIGLRREPSC